MSPQPPITQEEYLYTAFISYRHSENDRRWAEWLHSAIETYRVPRRLRTDKGLPARLGPLFRDEDELPASADLNQEIEKALQQSRFLIVVCSPRTPKSEWVNKEIVRFREMNRDSRILALLIEGEPSESFPVALREIRRTVVEKDGSTQESIEEVEPLAADVRNSRRESKRYLARMAKLRFLACLLGVRFDDLRQRDQERQTRVITRTILGSLLLACLAVVIASYAFVQRSLAERNATESRQRLVRQYVEEGNRLVSSGDISGSLPWFVAGSELDVGGANSRLVHDIRLAANLRKCSKLVFAWPDAFRIRDFDFDSTGEYVAAACSDGKGRIWNIRTGHVTELVHDDPVLRIAFNHDGTQIMTTASDKTGRSGRGAPRECGTLRLAPPVTPWLFHNGPAKSDPEVAARIKAGFADYVMTGQGIIWDAAFSPDGSLLATAGDDKTARVWNITNGQAVGEPLKHTDDVKQVQFAQGGDKLLTASSTHTLVWDIASGRKLADLNETMGTICRSRNWLITVQGKDIRIRDLATLIESQKIESSTNAQKLACSSDGRWLAVTSYGEQVTIYDLKNLADGLVHLPISADYLEFAPDTTRLITAGGDAYKMSGEVRIWDVGNQKLTLPPIRYSNGRAIFDPSGSYVATAEGVWSLLTNERTYLPIPRSFTVREFSSASRQIIASDPSGHFATLDLNTGKSIAWPHLVDHFKFALFSPDGSQAAVATGSSTDDKSHFIQTFDPLTGMERTTGLNHKFELSGAAISPQNDKLVTISGSGGFPGHGEIRQYSLPHAALDWPAIDIVGEPISVGISPDGKWIAVATREMDNNTRASNSVRIVSSRDGSVAKNPFPNGAGDRIPRFISQGKELLVNDGLVSVPLSELRTIKKLPVPVLDISPNGAVFVGALSSSDDTRLRVYNTKTGEALTAPLAVSDNAKFVFDGAILVCSTKGAFQLWSVETGQAITPPYISKGRVWMDEVSRSIFDESGQVWNFNIPADQNDTKDLRLIAQIVSGHDVDSTGGYVIRRNVFGLWKELRNSRPLQDFVPNKKALIEWQERTATELGVTDNGRYTSRVARGIVWHLNRLAKEKPLDQVLLLMRAESNFEIADWEHSANDYTDLLGRNDVADKVELMQNRGKAFYHGGRWADALRDLNRALESGSYGDNEINLAYRGATLAALGNKEAADAELKNVVSHGFTSDVMDWFQKELLKNIEHKNWRIVHALSNALLQWNSGDRFSLRWRGIAAAELGDWTASVQDLTALSKSQELNTVDLFSLYIAIVSSGQAADYDGKRKKLIESNELSGNADLFDLIALISLTDFDGESRQLIQRAAALCDNTANLIELATLNLRTGHNNEALTIWERLGEMPEQKQDGEFAALFALTLARASQIDRAKTWNDIAVRWLDSSGKVRGQWSVDDVQSLWQRRVRVRIVLKETAKLLDKRQSSDASGPAK